MISVCMACYNGQKYIRQQIDSILCQIGLADELIISDDGSQDKTCEIIHSIQDPRIKLLHNKGKHGFVWNFENALREAHGDVIFLSDQDDYWKEGKLRAVMLQLQKYQLVVHDADLIDGNGNSLEKRYYQCTNSGTSFLANLWKTRWLGCCMAFRKEVLDLCLPFPKNIPAHDYWIGMLGMLKFKYYFMPDVLICYRRHGNNASFSSEKSGESLWYKVIQKRGALLFEIVRKLFQQCVK